MAGAGGLGFGNDAAKQSMQSGCESLYSERIGQYSNAEFGNRVQVQLRGEPEHFWVGAGRTSFVGMAAGRYLDGDGWICRDWSKSKFRNGKRSDVQFPVYGYEWVQSYHRDITGYRRNPELCQLLQHLL